MTEGPRRRVVIAEDEALIRLDLKEMLQENGYVVVGEAGDGEQAIRLATDLRPDLVILDVKMPVLDGISAAERIVAERIAPCLILTAFSQRDLIERARDAGAMAFLVKPFTATDLVPAIETAVSRHLEMVALAKEVADLSARLETRKLVERAKDLLMTRHGWTEPQAFRWLQKTAADRRLSMRNAAQLALAERPDPSTAQPLEQVLREALRAHARYSASPGSASVPVTLYLGDEGDSASTEGALADLLRAFGYDDLDWSPPIRGSWLRRMIGRTADMLTSDGAKDIGSELRRAIELQGLHRAQAEVDEKKAAAASALITALGSQRKAAVLIGSLLLLKDGDTCVVRELTQKQLIHMERNPALLQDPAALLTALQCVEDAS